MQRISVRMGEAQYGELLRSAVRTCAAPNSRLFEPAAGQAALASPKMLSAYPRHHERQGRSETLMTRTHTRPRGSPLVSSSPAFDQLKLPRVMAKDLHVNMSTRRVHEAV